MSSVKLTYNDPDVGASASASFSRVTAVKGWYEPDELERFPALLHQHLSGNLSEQNAGVRRIITLDLGVVTTFALRKAVAYFFLDSDRQINLVMAAPTNLAVTAGVGVTALANGTYYYRVSAVDEVGETTGATQDDVVITDNGNQIPTLSWDAVTNASSYRVYRTASTGDYWGEVHFLKEVTGVSTTDDGSVALTSTYVLPQTQALTVVMEDPKRLVAEWLHNSRHARRFLLRVKDATLRTSLIP